MKTSWRVPWYNRIGRLFLVVIFRVVLRIISQVEVRGLENIPKKGAYIVAFNHVSLYDPPIVGAFLPKQPEVLGASEVWDRPGQNLLARIYGGIPIRRGEVDRTALERCLAVLRSGSPLMLAPEGTRSHQPGLQPAKPGIVYLVERTGVPVVPVAVVGTTDEYITQALHGKRPQVKMLVGKPFYLPKVIDPELPPKEARQYKADFIMEHIAALLPLAYRGVYKGFPTRKFSPHQASSS